MVLHSEKRALKDAKDRQRLIKKANKLLTSCDYDTYGGKKYIKRINSKIALNQEKIEEDKKMGWLLWHTHNTSLDATDVAKAYHDLWRIENSFRMMKNYFATHPMFHWTEKRIYDHVALNFIAYVFETHIEKLVNRDEKQNKQLSPNDIRGAINAMKESYVNIEGNEFKVACKLPENAQLILNNLGITLPKSFQIKEVNAIKV